MPNTRSAMLLSVVNIEEETSGSPRKLRFGLSRDANYVILDPETDRDDCASVN